MPNGEAGRRSPGSLLPAGLYATLGLRGPSAEHADTLVALALEEHFVWAGIRLRREQAAQGFRMSDEFGRAFVTNDRLDADLAPRNGLVSRIGVLLGMSDQMAEVATTLLETHIDTQVLSGQPFAAPGLFITAHQESEPFREGSPKWDIEHPTIGGLQRPTIGCGYRRAPAPFPPAGSTSRMAAVPIAY